MFNQFAESTAYITVQNLPQFAGAFKSSLLKLPYANNYPWYNDLVNAKAVKDIFALFNLTFVYKDNNFYPVVKNVEALSYKTVLEAVAPYVSDGTLFIKDDFFYYQLWFNTGKIRGTRRKIEDGNPLEVKTAPPQPVTTTPQPAKAKTPVKTSKGKKYGNTQVRSNRQVSSIDRRDNNMYTVREAVQELLRQIDNGNADMYVSLEADFLFKATKYA